MARTRDCYFKKNNLQEIDYRNTDMLKRYLSPWGKIKSARETKTSSKYQRMLAVAIKRSRFLGLLPPIGK